MANALSLVRLHCSCASLNLSFAAYPHVSSNAAPVSSFPFSRKTLKLWTPQKELQLPRSRSDPLRSLDLSTLEDEEAGESLVAAPPPTEGNKTLEDPKELLRRTVGFVIEYEWDDPSDMRELSEMPEVRLWFVRLDAMYPWLPAVLDWRAGELARYAAMLVPHQMKKKEGLVFNPEGLELFVMSKLFTVYPWLQSLKVARPDAKVNDMLRVLGYKIEAELFQLLES